MGAGIGQTVGAAGARPFWPGIWLRSGWLRSGLRRSGWLGAVSFALVGLALASCSLPNGAGSLLVDPGRYSAYHCNDLATQWKMLLAREQELRGLMDKAGENGNGAGALIGSVAYRPDYESVLTDEKLVKREAMEKKCPFADEFQSDETIR